MACALRILARGKSGALDNFYAISSQREHILIAAMSAGTPSSTSSGASSPIPVNGQVDIASPPMQTPPIARSTAAHYSELDEKRMHEVRGLALSWQTTYNDIGRLSVLGPT